MQKLYMFSKSKSSGNDCDPILGNHNEIIFKLQTYYGIPVNNHHLPPNNNNDLYQSESKSKSASKSESDSAMVSSSIAWHRDRLSMQKNPEDNKETVVKRKPPATAAAGHGHGEEEENNSIIIIVVGLHDVLFGKDRISKQHPGNRKWNQLIVNYQNDYENVGSKYGKTDIAERIITKIHNDYGGRFLRKEDRKDNSSSTNDKDKDNSNHNCNYCWKEVERNVAREKISHYFRRIRDNNNKLSSTATATIATATSSSSSSKRTTPCHSTSSTLLDGFDKGEGDDDDDDDDDEKEIISEGDRILKKNR
ncbi:hypothetical protein FRACYDRAFT_233595 [Fragilariopsis cylindrus CCMP1102]|uniref:DUF6824 domain-containing protein n=1 Tax=Fragilariopsis cylindrus CCMP1102 TaxID=635003 RepID=A0A1E7FZ81_9STRA|nr:hypothetical protein FRACYDRAFT_233595 [Fragilariopsis cylindrus CCMP1102]|eukprot:OEU23424.1 hypothetical protein FRACYDRAFT_233595 [Fragilariopsis cylindrus CCMP1102]